MRLRKRGTATIEAVCALFVFFPLWAGVMHLGELYSAQIEAEADARRCAWLISAGACSGEVAGCGNVIRGGEAGSRGDDLPSWEESPGGRGGLGSVVSEALGSLMKELFGRRAEASSGREIAGPKLLGAETVEVGASYSLPCNTTPRDVGDLATEGIRLFKD